MWRVRPSLSSAISRRSTLDNSADPLNAVSGTLGPRGRRPRSAADARAQAVEAARPLGQHRRVARAQAFYRRNARGIAALQQAGLVRSELDPLLTTKALSAMVSRTCRGVYLDEPDAAYATEEGAAQLADALTALWTGALGLRA